jgi:hypothetical protein
MCQSKGGRSVTRRYPTSHHHERPARRNPYDVPALSHTTRGECTLVLICPGLAGRANDGRGQPTLVGGRSPSVPQRLKATAGKVCLLHRVARISMAQRKKCSVSADGSKLRWNRRARSGRDVTASSKTPRDTRSSRSMNRLRSALAERVFRAKKFVKLWVDCQTGQRCRVMPQCRKIFDRLLS